MKQVRSILVLSDTHGYIDETILNHASQADEIWHAGDIGSQEVIDALAAKALVRCVYGNIDSHALRMQTKDFLNFECAGVSVFMTHITGYPPKYAPGIISKIKDLKPSIVVGGHSHICKVMHDSQHSLLYINPGAIGKTGFHAVRTMIRFEICNGKPQNLAVIEMPRW
ncbi:MAG: phosphodiesterase [Bacteroidetes bacterium ADurb.Bin217]|nr:MAG: phosphodiesterase [Bacteroidetes bacterium ADurb.Bin217]